MRHKPSSKDPCNDTRDEQCPKSAILSCIPSYARMPPRERLYATLGAQGAGCAKEEHARRSDNNGRVNPGTQFRMCVAQQPPDRLAKSRPSRATAEVGVSPWARCRHTVPVAAQTLRSALSHRCVFLPAPLSDGTRLARAAAGSMSVNCATQVRD